MKLHMITGLGAIEGLASGKQNALFETLQEFHTHWDRIDIICPKIKNETGKVKTYFGNVYVHVSPWPLVFYPVYFVWKAVMLNREVCFDGMTVHDFPPFYNGIGARIIWSLTKVPYILEIMHIPGIPKAGNLKEEMYAIFAKIFIQFDARRARAVRVINSLMAKFLEEIHLPAKKIHVIPAFYIDLSVFKPLAVEKRYDLIFVGRLEPNKGIDLFLETVQELDCSAVVVGQGPLMEKVRRKIKSETLKVEILGWAKDTAHVAQTMNQARVLVMTSYNEGGPRVALEAMACGVPVVATRVGIIPDILPESQQVDWNVNDIANKTRCLLEDQDAYENSSRLGIQTAGKYEKQNAIRVYANSVKAILNQ